MTISPVRRISSGASILALIIGALALPATAQAAERDGVCDSGEVCFYHNSNQQGSVSDFAGSIPNYGESQPECYEFRGPGKGQGECLKNDAASVTNNTDQPVIVYYNSNFKGTSQTIPAGASVNLDPSLKNNNASHQIGTDTTDTPPEPGSATNPHGPEWGSNGGYTLRARWLKDKIEQEFPGVTCSTYETSKKSSSHYTGNGLDCFGSPEERDRLAKWTSQNAHNLKVWYVIHNQEIFSLTNPQAGWKGMKDRGSDSANHKDHVHISLQDPKHQF